MNEVNSRIGIILALVAAAGNSVGLHIQKLAHDRVKHASKNAHLMSPMWWFGFACIILAELFGAIAYGFAPAIVVSSLGGAVVVFTTILAVCHRRERFTSTVGAGVLCVIVGGTLLAIATPVSTQMLSEKELIHIYVSGRFLAILSIGIILLLVASTLPKERWLLLRLAGAAATVSSFTVLAVRGLVNLLANFEYDCSACACRTTLASPLFWALVWVTAATAIASGAFIEQYGLQRFPETQWVPVHFVACALLFGGTSAIVFQDLALFSAAALVVTLFGVVLALWGVGLANVANVQP